MHDVNKTVEPVEQAVQQAAQDAPVRVFTLGIGSTTSTAMCEGISRAGNGICLMATTTETIIGKCSRLVRASRTYVLKNVSVDWGVRTDLAEAYRTGSTELKGVRQAPAKISSLYPGSRFVVFALVEDEAFTPPKEVVIRAQRDGYGEVLQFSVLVQVVELSPEHHPKPLIQTLAARRAIMDLEDRSRTTASPEAKSLITQLGTQYQLASKYTSFVAVDKRTRAEVGERLVERSRNAVLPPTATVTASARTPRRVAGGSATFAMARSYLGSARLVTPMDESAAAHQHHVVTRYNPVPSPTSASSRATRPNPTDADTVTLRRNLFTPDVESIQPPPLTSTSSQPQSHESATWMPPESWDAAAAAEAAAADSDSSIDADLHWLPRGKTAVIPLKKKKAKKDLLPPAQDTLSAPSTELRIPGMTSTAFRLPDISSSVPEQQQQPEDSDKVLQLIRLQSFDGSFPADNRLLALLDVSFSSFAEMHGDDVPDMVWSTVLAVVWLRAHMIDEPELLESLVEKAMEFVSQAAPGVDADGVLARAQEALSVLVKVSEMRK